MITTVAVWTALLLLVAMPCFAAGYLTGKSKYAPLLRTVQAALLERLGQRRYNQVIREANQRIRAGRGYG